MGRKPKKSKPTKATWDADASNPLEVHTLLGIEPSNLLGFMALLGTLRALETARAEWFPCVYWDVGAPSWHPLLKLRAPQSQAAVAEAVTEGVGSLAPAHALTGDAKDLKFAAEEFASLREKAVDSQQMVLDALSSEMAIDERNESLRPTPFAFMFGQGHQHFLSRFRDVPSTIAKAAPNSEAVMDFQHRIAAALFAPWRRADRTVSFRWDPTEDRRYAYRDVDPSGDPITTEHGANCLSAIALPLFPVIPVRRRSGIRLLTPMTRFGSGGKIEFNLPIWSAPARLSTIMALLNHPEIVKDSPDVASLPQVHAVFRAIREPVGKFLCVTHAEMIT